MKRILSLLLISAFTVALSSVGHAKDSPPTIEKAYSDLASVTVAVAFEAISVADVVVIQPDTYTFENVEAVAAEETSLVPVNTDRGLHRIRYGETLHDLTKTEYSNQTFKHIDPGWQSAN